VRNLSGELVRYLKPTGVTENLSETLKFSGKGSIIGRVFSVLSLASERTGA
jgi:hypothetical protein